MKIAIIGTAHPYRGGLAAFNERLALQFAAEGHEVIVYTFTLQYPGFLFPGKTQLTGSPAPEGLKIRRCINSCNPFNWLKVGRMVRKGNPDVVVFAYWMSFMAPCFGTIARVIRRKGKKAKVIGLIHNMIPHEPNIMDRLFPRWFTGAMDGFTALSESVIEDIKHFDGEGIKHFGRKGDKHFDGEGKPKTFAPHPIYDHYGERMPKAVARKALGIPEEGRYVLFFGFIRSYKGLDLLLRAMADPRLEDVRLIVAGEFYGDPKPYLDLIDSLGIRDRVLLFNDYIPDNEVNLYFNACDIVAQPYKTATQSGVTQIAFHFEKPMLVTNVGGLPEIVPDGVVGYVAEPEEKSIASALHRFYTEGREAQLIEGVRSQKQKYSWSRMSAAVLAAAGGDSAANS